MIDLILLSDYIIVLILSFKISMAQVGVGTIVPEAQLDIRSSNQASPAIDDGVQASPRRIRCVFMKVWIARSPAPV